MTRYLMIIDVESIGLYGQAFCVGYVVYDRNLKGFLAKTLLSCPHTEAFGETCFKDDVKWVEENVIQYLPTPSIRCDNPQELRNIWYDHYNAYKTAYGTELSLWADCIYPVETNFLRQVALDNVRDRAFKMPYPIHEIATIRQLVGLNPTASYDLPKELSHNPIAECEYIVRCLDNWLTILKF